MFTLTSQDIHGVMIKEATKKGYDVAGIGDSVNLAQPKSKTRETSCNQGVLISHEIISREFKNTGWVDICPTLCARDYKGSKNIKYTNNRIRRLTPLECWRLQGFTDDAFYKAKKVNSNSQLYKQAGNNVTVTAIEAIGAELKEIYR